MLALGIIFLIIGNCGLFFHFLLIFPLNHNYFEAFIEAMQQPERIIFYISLFFIIWGIVFIILAKRKKKRLQSQKQAEIKEQKKLQDEITELKQKELELNILKEHNLIIDNKPKFCKYCGAKLKDNKCPECGAYTQE